MLDLVLVWCIRSFVYKISWVCFPYGFFCPLVLYFLLWLLLVCLEPFSSFIFVSTMLYVKNFMVVDNAVGHCFHRALIQRPANRICCPFNCGSTEFLIILFRLCAGLVICNLYWPIFTGLQLLCWWQKFSGCFQLSNIQYNGYSSVLRCFSVVERLCHLRSLVLKNTCSDSMPDSNASMFKISLEFLEGFPE